MNKVIRIRIRIRICEAVAYLLTGLQAAGDLQDQLQTFPVRQICSV
jgi:hypothetical protein